MDEREMRVTAIVPEPKALKNQVHICLSGAMQLIQISSTF